ncbi:Hypothetical protein A7982_00413 [Minicystis rosea]|nr:Hypothetical protein A7982_00413 [Minicystis rosea]
MNRPTRQRTNLLEKIARKESRNPGKAGKRLKRWKKWAENYKAVAEGVQAAS